MTVISTAILHGIIGNVALHILTPVYSDTNKMQAGFAYLHLIILKNVNKISKAVATKDLSALVNQKLVQKVGTTGKGTNTSSR